MSAYKVVHEAAGGYVDIVREVRDDAGLNWEPVLLGQDAADLESLIAAATDGLLEIIRELKEASQ